MGTKWPQGENASNDLCYANMSFLWFLRSE
jgi:hypothetical protein